VSIVNSTEPSQCVSLPHRLGSYLYLETYFNKKYDVQEIIDFLKGRYEPRLANKPLTKYILKLASVAMSRPTHLLGLALHVEHLNAKDIEELKDNNCIVTYA
jgi:hypothetical protein